MTKSKPLSGLLIGFVCIAILGNILISAYEYIADSSGKFLLLIVGAVVLLSCHYFIYKRHGGWIPEDGRPTIHSKIILIAIIIASLLIALFFGFLSFS